ncbi:hypothetical protein ACJX0J_014980, partial [Zea mays]
KVNNDVLDTATIGRLYYDAKYCALLRSLPGINLLGGEGWPSEDIFDMILNRIHEERRMHNTLLL